MDPNQRKSAVNLNEDGADSILESWLQKDLNDDSDDEQGTGQSKIAKPTNFILRV